MFAILKKAANSYIHTFKGLSQEVWKLAGVLLINRSGMMVLPFLSIYVIEILGWSKFQAGIITSCYGLGSLTGAYFGGILTDKIGEFKTMIMSLILSGVCFISLGFLTEFYSLCALMFITVTFADFFRPASFSLLAKITEKHNVTRGISLIRMAINLGIAIGPAVGGFFAATIGYFWLFAFDGGTCLLAALFMFIAFKPKESFKPKPKELTKGKSPFADAYFMGFMFVNILNLIVFFQILNVVPVYFREVLLLSESQIGWFFTINGLIIVVFEMPIIYILEEKKYAFIPLLIGMVMIGVSFLSFHLAFISGFLAVSLYTLLTTFGEIINFPFINTIALKRSNEDNRGAYMGATAMLFSVAFILAPLLGLPIVEMIGYDIYWTICFVVCILATFVGYYIKNKMETDGVAFAT